jgi:hypothetical protein
MLGELASFVSVTRNAVELSIEHGWERERDGMWFPDGAALDPMSGLLATWMPRVAEKLTLIGGHNLLTTPTRSQLDDPTLRPLIDEMLSALKTYPPMSALRCSVWRGTSSAARWPAEGSCTNASSRHQPHATANACTNSTTARAPTSWWTHCSALPAIDR